MASHAKSSQTGTFHKESPREMQSVQFADFSLQWCQMNLTPSAGSHSAPASREELMIIIQKADAEGQKHTHTHTRTH